MLSLFISFVNSETRFFCIFSRIRAVCVGLMFNAFCWICTLNEFISAKWFIRNSHSFQLIENFCTWFMGQRSIVGKCAYFLSKVQLLLPSSIYVQTLIPTLDRNKRFHRPIFIFLCNSEKKKEREIFRSKTNDDNGNIHIGLCIEPKQDLRY